MKDPLGLQALHIGEDVVPEHKRLVTMYSGPDSSFRSTMRIDSKVSKVRSEAMTASNDGGVQNDPSFHSASATKNPARRSVSWAKRHKKEVTAKFGDEDDRSSESFLTGSESSRCRRFCRHALRRTRTGYSSSYSDVAKKAKKALSYRTVSWGRTRQFESMSSGVSSVELPLLDNASTLVRKGRV